MVPQNHGSHKNFINMMWLCVSRSLIFFNNAVLQFSFFAWLRKSDSKTNICVVFL